MDLYLDAYRSHVQQLRSSGATVSNEIEASVLLNGLDKGYESFIVATTQSFRQTTSMSTSSLASSVTKTVDELRARLPSLVMPVPEQLISPIQSAVLVLLVTTVKQKDTSRTTAGNCIPKSEI